MKPCTILDIGVLSKIVKDYRGEDMLLRIRSDLLNGFPYSTWFLQGETCMCYEPLGYRKVQAHIYSLPTAERGKKLRDFAVESGRWMVDNTDAESILNFVEEDRIDLKLFMKMIGSQRIGKIPGTGQILYVSTGDMGIKE